MTQRLAHALDKMELVRTLAAFRHLTSAQHALLHDRLRLCNFAPRECIFEQGDEGDGLYIIAHGHVQISITSQNGHERIVRILDAGQLLGELSLLDQEPRAARAVALNRTVALSLHKHDFHDILNNHPAILVTILLTELTTSVRYADTHAEIVMDPSIPRRMIRMLILLAERNAMRYATARSFVIEFNQTQLSAMIGTTRETVNRIARLLQDAGALALITHQGRKCIEVVDMQRLYDALEDADGMRAHKRPQ